jgi:hypothetical protein
MSEPQDNEARDAIAFVKLGYGDSFGLRFRSPYFRTDILTTIEAQAAMRIIEYNAFALMSSTLSKWIAQRFAFGGTETFGYSWR